MDWDAFKTEWESGFPKIRGKRLETWPSVVRRLRVDRAVKGIEHLRARYAASEWEHRSAPTVYDLETLCKRYEREDAEASGWTDPARKPDPTERWWPVGIVVPLILDIYNGRKAEAREHLRRLCAEIDQARDGEVDAVYQRRLEAWSREVEALPDRKEDAAPHRAELPLMAEVLDELAFMGPKPKQLPPFVHEPMPIPDVPFSPPDDELDADIPF